MVLNDALNTKKNNVPAVKAVAAWLVIAGHSFAFACDYELKDFMAIWSKDAYNLGGFAVSVFFFFSGLFIAKSLLSGKYNLKSYTLRRIGRIFPPFIFVTAAIVVLSGLFITELEPGEYFTNPDSYRYLLNCVFVTVHNLPGVFRGNIYGPTVNGPIWTIKIEVLCYAVCYLFYKCRLFDRRWAAYIGLLALSGVIWLYRIDNVPPDIIILVRPMGMFFMGVLYTVYSRDLSVDIRSTLLSVAGFAAMLALGFPETGIFLMLPGFICGLAFLFQGENRLLSALGKVGDASYEIYLWGGFTGQTVVWLFGGSMSPWPNMGFTIVAATVLGLATHAIFTRKVKKRTA